MRAPQFESRKGVQVNSGELFSDQLERVVAWSAIEGYPLIVVSGLTEAGTFKSYAGTQNAYLLFAVTVTVLAILVSIFGYRAHIRSRQRSLRAERVRDTFRLAVEGAQEAFYMIELIRSPDGSICDCVIEDCNERAAGMNGLQKSQILQKRFSELYEESIVQKLIKVYERCYTHGIVEHEFFSGENSQHQQGWFFRRAIRSGEGIAVTIRDITAAKLHEEKQIKLGFTDPLTGLPNRRWLDNFLPEALLRAQSKQLQLALLFIDLDNFKKVNDTLGHADGDELLIAAAKFLKGLVRSVDQVARLGGDEFTIIIENQENALAAELIAEEVIQVFAESEIFRRWHDFNIRCSIGIALFPAHAADTSSLLRCADEAMYAAKTAGKGCYRVFHRANVDES